MSNVTVCVRFRPLNSKEKRANGDSTCIRCLDTESFLFQDEKEEDLVFWFDRVFYQDSAQVDVYEFLALPVVQEVLNGRNGTIITYGQTGAGKTYSMEGPSLLQSDEHKKGLLPRVVNGLFNSIGSSSEGITYCVKLSMVEIYMEKVRDLFDLSKDNIQIKESKTHGIHLSGTTEILIMEPAEALKCLSRGIANRTVGETYMNMSSSRSHCIYMFSVQQESSTEKGVKAGKLVLVDLAGSEKVEKTGAEGRVLEEAKSINKSLSALGNVINALTSGKLNYIPYRDSKLTRILQDALSGNSRTALLCCCSPSFSNASESLSTLRFGTRTKLVKSPIRASPIENKAQNRRSIDIQNESSSSDSLLDNDVEQQQVTCHQTANKSRGGMLNKFGENPTDSDAKLLHELSKLEGLPFEHNTADDVEAACDNAIIETISALERAVKDLKEKTIQLEAENDALKSGFSAIMESGLNGFPAEDFTTYIPKVLSIISLFCYLVWFIWGFLEASDSFSRSPRSDYPT